MNPVSPSKSFTWSAVAIFYFVYLFVLIVGQEFHPWLEISFLDVNLRAIAFYFLPVAVGIYLFLRSQQAKIFAVCAALVIAPMFLVLLNFSGLDFTRFSFVLNWPVYALLADRRDKITIPKESGEVFLGGGWSSSYVYNANDQWWIKYQEELQATNLAKRRTAATFEIRDYNSDRECRVVTPLVGHWYLEYQQYGGGFRACEGIEKR